MGDTTTLSRSAAVKLKNPPATGPVNLKNLFHNPMEEYKKFWTLLDFCEKFCIIVLHGGNAMGRVYLSGLIDDYFPDYQSDCGFVILLNDGLAQKGGGYRFFC